MRWMFIVAGLLAAALAVAVMYAWSRKARRSRECEVSLAAMVKKVSLNGVGGSMASFAGPNGEMSFVVPKELARQLHSGDRGVLTYRGEQFVYFVPREGLFGNEAGQRLQRVS